MTDRKSLTPHELYQMPIIKRVEALEKDLDKLVSRINLGVRVVPLIFVLIFFLNKYGFFDIEWEW